MVRNLIFLSSLLANVACQTQSDKPFLSTLKADKNTPIYATYAAAMDRSEFVLDEGYEYNYYSDDKGADFSTDTGGDLGLGFFINNQWIYETSDFNKPPVITLSYPDMVFSHYYPVEDLKVESRFLIYSSSAAIHEITLENNSENTMGFEIIPFIRNEYRAFNNVEKFNDSSFFFTHEEYPDSWTLSHGLPYEDTIQNIFMISEFPQASGSFNSEDGASPVIPWQVFPDKSPRYQLRGRSFIRGERNLTGPPMTRFYATIINDYEEIITENSPVWGNTQGSINLDGYYRVELGLLDASIGDNFRFMISYESDGLAAFWEGTIEEGTGIRKDLDLGDYSRIPTPQFVNLEREDGHFRLSWQQNADDRLITYIYRREYPDQHTYKLIGKTRSNEFADPDPGKICGYVLAHYDTVSNHLGPQTREYTTLDPIVFSEFKKGSGSDAFSRDFARYLAFRLNYQLEPGGSRTFRMVRTVGRNTDPSDHIFKEAEQAIKVDFDDHVKANEELFSGVKRPARIDTDLEYLYWSSFNMMRQVFYPPEAKSSYNYYVFSREPTWGWGHGGQVFHESLTMPAYALLDPVSAMNSQRVYAERQYENGYINYRTGSYLDEIIEFNDQLTSSAPWYNYQNWQLYEITRDKDFLEEMYQSGKRFYNFYVSNRDKDQDGLCEWGGHAVLESVRDALVAVWDEVGWPSNFEAVDLNSMLVMEARSLEKMARELGLENEADSWANDWGSRSELVNSTFWDEETGFYYHVDLDDHDFTYKTQDDLKREEIIGFLPLWAGIATDKQAELLLKKLTNPQKFWRKYGVPSLSADDPYFNDKGYWNGPVWVEWNYLIVQGLLDYGYIEEARELTTRVAEGMIHQLKTNHNLWEFYSPDTTWAGYHKTYIWAGIINKMIWDVRDR